MLRATEKKTIESFILGDTRWAREWQKQRERKQKKPVTGISHVRETHRGWVWERVTNNPFNKYDIL